MKGFLVLPAVLALAFCVGVGLLTWVCSLIRKDASLADRAWPLSVGGAGLLQILVFPGTASTRAMVMALLGVVWALRLGIFITARNWGHGEDHRYRDMRLRHAPDFDWKSLYLVFGLQAVLAWIMAAPFLAGSAGERPLSLADAAGASLAGFGIAFEAAADAQLARFKADPAHRGQVMDKGLWRFTRHPNYFGEACFWWGLWLMAVSGAGWAGAWSLVSPLLMTVLLLKVSGVGLLEKDIAERRPAYREYIARTNAFVPGPPRRAVS
jgi:steroid 5-alpha reductase family enzyme